MNNWKNFWGKYRLTEIKNDKDLLYQVGKTVNKEVIDNELFNKIINSIDRHLELNKNDNLLDLCCGNGVLTYEISKNIKSSIGVDFSRPYIINAKKFKQAQNIKYLNFDIKKIHDLNFNQKFSKVIIYDALAYFNYKDLDRLFKSLKKITTPDVKILIGSVLSYEKKWNFFNTGKRKFYHFINKILGQSKGLGKWWKRKELKKIAEKNNLKICFMNQDDKIHTSHYRIDILLTK